MNNTVKDEVARVNAPDTLSEFEKAISQDIFFWVMLNDHSFDSIADASVAFWNERLSS